MEEQRVISDLIDTVIRLDNLENKVEQSEEEIDLMFTAINYIKKRGLDDSTAHTQIGQLLMDIHNRIDRCIDKGLITKGSK